MSINKVLLIMVITLVVTKYNVEANVVATSCCYVIAMREEPANNLEPNLTTLSNDERGSENALWPNSSHNPRNSLRDALGENSDANTAFYSIANVGDSVTTTIESNGDGSIENLSIHGDTANVVVAENNPFITTDVDKISYHVEIDTDAESKTLLEILDKVPLITVDGDDEIRVRGSSTFSVYVNGKYNSMMSSNPAEIFRNMPANTIKKVEVVTNPSSRYEAEGEGEVLLIETNGSSTLSGYNLILNGFAFNIRQGGGVSGTVAVGKFTITANYTYSYNNGREAATYGSTLAAGERAQCAYDQFYNGRNKRVGNFQYGNAEASYEVDSKRLISANFGFRIRDNNNKGYNDNWGLSADTVYAKTLYEYKNEFNNNTGSSFFEGGVGYQRSFSSPEQFLTISYKINSTPSFTKNRTLYVLGQEPDVAWSAFLSNLKDQYNNEHQNMLDNIFQVDFSTPIATNQSLEAGVRYMLRNNNSKNDRYLITNQGDIYNEERSMHYKHVNNIFALYFNYGIKVKQFSAKAGLRYEYNLQHVNYILGQGTDFTSHFNDFVPSATIGWSLTDKSALGAGYNMRIVRPTIGYLNPYLNDNDPVNISQGNYNLESEKVNTVNVNYNLFTDKVNVNLSLDYIFINNAIQGVSSLMKDTDIKGLQNPLGIDVVYSTYENSGKSKTLSLKGFLSWNIAKSSRFYMNVTGNYVALQATELSNSGFSALLFGGFQQSFKYDWALNLNLIYASPTVKLQGKTNDFLNYGISLSKSFFDKRFTVTARATNMFNMYTVFHESKSGSDFIQETNTRVYRFQYGIRLSYRFGDLKTKVRKVQKSSLSDDEKSDATEALVE